MKDIGAVEPDHVFRHAADAGAGAVVVGDEEALRPGRGDVVRTAEQRIAQSSGGVAAMAQAAGREVEDLDRGVRLRTIAAVGEGTVDRVERRAPGVVAMEIDPMRPKISLRPKPPGHVADRGDPGGHVDGEVQCVESAGGRDLAAPPLLRHRTPVIGGDVRDAFGLIDHDVLCADHTVFGAGNVQLDRMAAGRGRAQRGRGAGARQPQQHRGQRRPAAARCRQRPVQVGREYPHRSI